MNCLQLSVAPSKFFGFTSSRVSTTPSPLTPRTRVSVSVARCSAEGWHDGNQLFQRVQSILRGHVVNTTVSATERSTTGHVVRSYSLRYHVYVKQCDDTFPHLTCFEPENCMRAFRQKCVHTSSDKSTRYQVSVSNTVREATGFRSIPTNIHKYPRSVSCHVPRCPIPP